MSTDPLLPRVVPAASIPSGGTHIKVVASPEERAAIAKDFAILGLPAFEATLEARRHGDEVVIEGRVKATVVQACVVSLVPVEQVIEHSFTRRFVKEHSRKETAAEDVDPMAEDPPDSFAETIDFGAVALEEMALQIEPYPRAPGVSFEPPADGSDPAADSPFAVLKSLRGRGST